MTRRRVFFLLLSCAAILGITFSESLRRPAVGQAPTAQSSKIRTLLEKKRDVLKQRVDSVEGAFQLARGSYDAVMMARNDLLDAELALATDKAQRITILEKKVENAKASEEIAQSARNSGQMQPADVLAATAHRIDSEIALLREQE